MGKVPNEYRDRHEVDQDDHRRNGYKAVAGPEKPDRQYRDRSGDPVKQADPVLHQAGERDPHQAGQIPTDIGRELGMTRKKGIAIE